MSYFNPSAGHSLVCFQSFGTSVCCCLTSYFISSNTETLSRIYCSQDDSRVDSHHDVIISKVSIPPIEKAIETPNVEAPKVVNDRVKIIWSPDGIDAYQSLLNPILPALRDEWLDSRSPSLGFFINVRSPPLGFLLIFILLLLWVDTWYIGYRIFSNRSRGFYFIA